MSADDIGNEGLSLVEVVIAMLILAVIAIAMLPSLWAGVRASSQQSSTATATRHLNSLVEEARANPICDTLTLITADDVIADGKGGDIEISSSYLPADCAEGTAVLISLIAVDGASNQLARVDAKVFVP